VSTESAEAPLRQGARPSLYSLSTPREWNDAGVDAAALECQGICGTEH